MSEVLKKFKLYFEHIKPKWKARDDAHKEKRGKSKKA